MSSVKILSAHIIVDVSSVMSKMTTISLALTMTSAKGILIAAIFNPRNFVLNRLYLYGMRVVRKGSWKEREVEKGG